MPEAPVAPPPRPDAGPPPPPPGKPPGTEVGVVVTAKDVAPTVRVTDTDVDPTADVKLGPEVEKAADAADAAASGDDPRKGILDLAGEPDATDKPLKVDVDKPTVVIDPLKAELDEIRKRVTTGKPHTAEDIKRAGEIQKELDVEVVAAAGSTAEAEAAKLDVDTALKDENKPQFDGANLTADEQQRLKVLQEKGDKVTEIEKDEQLRLESKEQVSKDLQRRDDLAKRNDLSDDEKVELYDLNTKFNEKKQSEAELSHKEKMDKLVEKLKSGDKNLTDEERKLLESVNNKESKLQELMRLYQEREMALAEIDRNTSLEPAQKAIAKAQIRQYYNKRISEALGGGGKGGAAKWVKIGALAGAIGAALMISQAVAGNKTQG